MLRLLLQAASLPEAGSLPANAPAGVALPPPTTPLVDWLFYLLFAVTVAMALLVVARRNPLQGALALVVGFFALSGIYVLLFAHLLAALQVLVYAGAIMVLFVFVIMLLNLQDRELGGTRGFLSKLIAVGLLTLFLVGAGVAASSGIEGAAFLPPPPPESAVAVPGALAPGYGTVTDVGTSLFTRYLLPFELVSVLLLAAIVGAVAIAKKRV
jgi:NADH-quinone oxidoreductase subunit J